MYGIDAVFFDLGDTLVDLGEGRGEYEALLAQRADRVYWALARQGAPPAERSAFCLALAEHTETSYQRALKAQAGIALPEVMRELFAQWGIPDREELIDAAVGAYCGNGGPGRPLRSGARPLLEALSARGIRLGIISNTIQPAEMMDRSLTRRGLLDFFGVRVYSSDYPWAKPHHALFKIALKALGVDAGRAVHVGDRLEADVLGAQAAGMLAVHISVAHRVEDRSIIRPDGCIDELPELLTILPRLTKHDRRAVG